MTAEPDDRTATSATDLAAAIRAGDVRSEDVVAATLERIADREGTLSAWAHLDPDLALEQARARDAEAPRGALHGVPVGVKDIIDTADQPTACGSPIYEGRRPASDATVVSRLRDAGAVIVGKTVTTEFALFHPGPTVNPHDPSRTPGGSSSGSAAAVGAGTILLALGTQTAGSVVRPASFCGVIGAKPTLGAVPTDGVKAVSHTLDTVGVFATSTADAALALGVMAADADRFRPSDLDDRVRIGLCRTHEWDRLEPATQRTVEAAAERLAGDLDVVEVELPAEFAGLVAAQMTIMGTEAARLLGPERREHPDRLSDQLRDYLDAGAALADVYDDALGLAGRCREALSEVFAGVDALLAPAALGEPPPIATTGDPLLCRAWTLLGTPTVAVPGLTGPAGLPLGVQVIAPPGRDAVALGAAELVARRLAAAPTG